MNEKFKQLALEAKMATANFDAGSYYVATPDRMQLFAELIVEECLDILEDEDDGSHDGRSVRIAAIRIKKLFGVEQ